MSHDRECFYCGRSPCRCDKPKPKPDIRCTTCSAEFVSDDIPDDVTSCPSCGTGGLPMRIKDDVKVTINTHELRILCMWADNYARSIERPDEPSSKACIAGIVRRLNKQLPGVALTMSAEFQAVADGLGTEVTVVDADGNRVIKPNKPN